MKQIGRQMLYFGEQELAAIMLSIKVAIWATFLSLPLAVWVAFLLVRRRFWGREILNVLFHLPLIMPSVVTGYLLLMLFGRTGVVGQVLREYFGITLAFRWTGAVLAAAIMAFPLVVRAVRLSIEQINPELGHVALTLGARPLTVLLTVTIPMALPGILVGAVLGFAKALGEFGATITFVGNIPNQTQTVPSAIYGFLQMPGKEQGAFTLVFISVCISITALLLSEWLARRVQKRVHGQ